MPRPCSADLRQRVVAAALDGGQPAEAVAVRFAVGRSTVHRWVEAAQGEGRLEAKPVGRRCRSTGGPRPTLRDDGEATLRRLVAADNHPRLAEHRDRLAEEIGVRVDPWTGGRALRRLGLTREKEALARGGAGRGRGRPSPGGAAARHRRDRPGAPGAPR
jgi:transposase